ncbi:DUF4087 domain-containing protein [Paracidovorax sp. MALMAid1276]|uniref:DUF4087 domain-containing protein n=1 Tax=Paracidovorax sp. MALMAid1276 TaxID=3411631 RepID=UPI003B9D7AFE
MTRTYQQRVAAWYRLATMATMACVLPFAAAQALAGERAQAVLPTLCGWLDNPTPGNVDFIDRDGNWMVGIQGGHQAAGKLPTFSSGRWVRTGHGSTGYGCVCMKARIDPDDRKILELVQARSMPLATCRKDPAIKGEEPFNPLK